MIRSIQVGTLVITFPIGRTLLASAALLVVIAGACEAAARSSVVRPYLVTPVISGQDQIAAKLDLLASVEAHDGPVDCFFVGSSMVLHDIDPEVLAQAYFDSTGKRITCFNFGLSGLNIEGAARLSQILIAQHHPRLIVYGTSFRDFIDQFGFDMDIPWARYQMGEASLEGWLETASMSYRYALAYADRTELENSGQYDQTYSMYGYLTSDGVKDVSKPPSRALLGQKYSAWENYTISSQAHDDLRRLLALKSTGTSLAIVEMPVPVSTLSLLGHPDQDYQTFADGVGAEARAQAIPFWLTLKANMIPSDGWLDYTHMNRSGGTVFSMWLGPHLAAAAQQGLIQLSTP
jgi:hypothetical protein